MGWSLSTTPLAVSVLFTALSIDIIRRLIRDRIERKGCPFPPGPAPLPFIGNALSISFKEPFKTFTEWRKTYGEIVHIRMFGTDAIILNSHAAATELLEKRSQVYSDRPFVATVKPYGHDSDFAFMHYGDHWRMCRRIFHQTFRAEAIVNFLPIQLRKARQLVLNMMDDPSDYGSHYNAFISGVTLNSIYDYDPRPKDDRMVSIINNFIETSFPAIAPERAILLQYFPFLLYVPEWIPGPSIKREARIACEMRDKAIEAPYQDVQRRIESEERINFSMVLDHITRMENFDDSYRVKYEKALKDASFTTFFAAVDTTSVSLKMFTLAMVKNPGIWKRAQADIDAIVGIDRLPEFDDRPSLPYIDAILRETLRWQPPVPLGCVHAPIQSDVYNGFYIPKGATIYSNVWAISRDESRYYNAEDFVPERFLNAEGRLTNDFPDFVFGFGRRACPGRHSLETSLWICITTMLATLDFNLARDVGGKDIEFEPKFECNITRHPLPFPCRITPRAHINKEAIERVLSKGCV